MKHGDRVTVTATLTRRSSHLPRDQKGGRTGWFKEWHRETLHRGARAGLFLGFRTLRNGWNEWGGEGEGVGFTPDGAPLKVALVSLASHLNPVYVPLDAVAPLGKPGARTAEAPGQLAIWEPGDPVADATRVGAL
jgi:hypothetical protein